MGKSTINGLFSIAMLNYQRVSGLERRCSMVPPKRTDNIQLARNEDGIHNGSRYPKHDFQRNPVPIHLESRKHPKSFPIPSLQIWSPIPSIPSIPSPIHGPWVQGRLPLCPTQRLHPQGPAIAQAPRQLQELRRQKFLSEMGYYKDLQKWEVSW